MTPQSVSETDVARFWRDGFLVLRGLAPINLCTELAAVATQHLDAQLAPIEYEVDVRYPGSPAGPDSEGAGTSRRLLQALSRDRSMRDWATHDEVAGTLRSLFGANDVSLSQCHHNCVMTKQPGFSSVTRWHQDNRYWSFDEQNLVSVWLALGNEHRRNGCLRVLPGSHRLDLQPGRFDAALFLRTDLPENKALLATALPVTLEAGDVLFFHSRLLHAASRNTEAQTKYSVVFTYHTSDNNPIRGTRSARYPSIPLGGVI